MPCLRTKVFWAPIANIRENPRKKPVKKADIKIIVTSNTIGEDTLGKSLIVKKRGNF